MHTTAHPYALLVGAAGMLLILSALAAWFLAPARGRPALASVREQVAERMRPVLADPAAASTRAWLDGPDREYADAVRTVTSLRRHDVPTVEHPAELFRRLDLTQAVPTVPARRPVEVTALIPVHRSVVVDERGWVDETHVWAVDETHVWAGATTEWSPAAELAAVGPGELLAAGTPTVTLDELTDDEIDEARIDAELAAGFAQFDRWFAAEVAQIEDHMSAAMGPKVVRLMAELRERDHGARERAEAQAEAMVTGEIVLPVAGPKLTPKQASRERHRSNRLAARARRADLCAVAP